MMTIQLIGSLSDETLSTRHQESVSRFQMSLQLAINKLTIDQEIAVLVSGHPVSGGLDATLYIRGPDAALIRCLLSLLVTFSVTTGDHWPGVNTDTTRTRGGGSYE